MRTGLSSIISSFPEIEKVVEISRSGNVVSEIFLDEYDIIVIDIESNDCTGSEIISELRAKVIDATIIVFTYSRNYKLKEECISRGANFFFLKSNEYDKLTYTIRRIAEGNLIWRN